MTDDSSPQPPPHSPHIIRRHPTGQVPQVPEGLEGPEDPEDDVQTTYVPQARPQSIAAPQEPGARPGTAIVAAVLSIFSGWATAVIATDLIIGWWRTDPLFCVAVGFLTTVSAAGLIGGLILLLLRRRMGRLLILVGAVVGLLIFGSLFVAGARLAPVVYAIPALPLAAILATLLPATRRWSRSG